MRRGTVAGAFVLALTAVTGCGTGLFTTRIGDLKMNPARFYNKHVTVQGEVTSAWGLPFVPLRLYKVDDGTGEVTVVSQGSRTPTKGAMVRVKGRVGEFAVLGGKSIGLHLEERNLNVKRYPGRGGHTP